MQQTRRLITGISDDGNSTLIADELLCGFSPYAQQCPSFQITNLFYTEDSPQSIDKTRHLDTPYDINLPEGAMRVLKIRMPTKQEMASDLIKAGQDLPEDWTKFNLHSTASIDYIYILSGQITCIVGNKAIELHKDDFLVQIGPEHTWINDNEEPCYILCIMSGTKPSGTQVTTGVENWR